VLAVEVNGPQPFGLPIWAQAVDVNREVVEAVAARGGCGLVDQGDDHAVVGVDARPLGGLFAIRVRWLSCCGPGMIALDAQVPPARVLPR
jgi:hypothetical protein